jgi:Protein of unknown function (DUF3455)
MRYFILITTLCSSITAAQPQDLQKLPEALAVKGGVTVATLQATGAQIYACAKGAKGALEWSFREPVAALFQNGKTVGRHFVGPTWEFADGTHVTGAPKGKVPATTVKDVPWLKLSIKEPATSGPIAEATTILRLDTKGGAWEGACSNEGELHAEPYAATYVFIK